MKIPFTALIYLLSISSYSQNDPIFTWAKGIPAEASLTVGGVSSALDDSGNIYTVGTFVDTVDFDPGIGIYELTSTGTYAAFIQKMDSNGAFVWAKEIGGSLYCYGNFIDVDSAGNVYVAGYFNGNVDFDPSPDTSYTLNPAGSNNNNKDGFVLKLDNNGDFVWARNIGGTGTYDEVKSLVVDSDGNVVITGNFGLTVDFDFGTNVHNITSNGNRDIFVQKLDSNGDFLWAKGMGGTSIDIGLSVALDDAGNIYVTGYFKETVDFDPGVGIDDHISNGSYDIFIQKLNEEGDYIWSKTFGGNSIDVGCCIAIDETGGNIYATGYFKETVDFDPGIGSINLTSAGDYDIFVLKMDSSGNFIWANSLGGTSNDVGKAVDLDCSGNIYVSGYFKETVDFDPGSGIDNHTSNGYEDIFVQKIDSSGNFIWAKSMGGNWNADQGRSINIDHNNYIYVTGVLNSVADFDPSCNTYNLTGDIVFVAKWGQNSINLLTDGNDDGCVNVGDLLSLLLEFGQCTTELLYDGNNDGCVDLQDFLQLLLEYGQCE